MNRKDREITARDEILDVLNRCDTIRLGLVNGEQPYVVPVSFGIDEAANGDEIWVYIHSAKRGLKADCIRQNQQVCLEGDIFYRVEPTERGITARYESVIGFGTIHEITDEAEKIHGLRQLLRHYSQLEHPLEKCRGLAATAVYKIVLHSLSGKRNLPETSL